MSRYFLLRVYRVRMRGVLRSFAYILKRRAATVTEYAGRARKKRRAWGGAGGGNKNACLCFARARDKGGGGLLERENRGNRGWFEGG